MATRYGTPPGPPAPARPPVTERVSTFLTWLALLVALVGVAGTLYLSISEGLVACPFCFYQRTLVMAIAAVLLVGLIARPGRSGFLSLVTLPLTVAGMGIAGYQSYLEYQGDMVCPEGALPRLYLEFRGADDFYNNVHEEVTAPREGLALFVILFLIQLIDLGRRGGFGLETVPVVIIVGGLIATGCILSATSCKIPPTKPVTGCYLK